MRPDHHPDWVDIPKRATQALAPTLLHVGAGAKDAVLIDNAPILVHIGREGEHINDGQGPTEGDRGLILEGGRQ